MWFHRVISPPEYLSLYLIVPKLATNEFVIGLDLLSIRCNYVVGKSLILKGLLSQAAVLMHSSASSFV